MDVSNLKRQHKEVIEMVDAVLENIKRNTVEENISDVVRSINTISGKLKIHLLNEDKHLYPKISKSSDPSLNAFGRKYSQEMDGFTKAYEEYKFKYNTSNKIKSDVSKFEKDSKDIFKVLMNRIDREEKELYPLLG